VTRSADHGASEHHITVERTARYWTRGGLPDRDGDLWFVLHGYKQLARRFLRRFAPIDAPGRLVVAPEALSRFYIGTEQGRHGPVSAVGGTWMTREDRLSEITDYVRYLDRLAAHCGASSHRVTVLGFSQGVATATRWAVRGAIRPARLLLWGDTTPPDLDTERAGPALAGVDVVLVRGSEDRSIEPMRVAAEEGRRREAGVGGRGGRCQGGREVEGAPLRGLRNGG
jgi:predicted esterase